MINKHLPILKGQGKEEDSEESLYGTAKTMEGKPGEQLEPGEVLCEAGVVSHVGPVLLRGQIRRGRQESTVCGGCMQVCGHLVQPSVGGAMGLKPVFSESRRKERQDWPPEEKTPFE